MAFFIRIGITAILIAACYGLWLKTPPLFWGTVVSEFQLLIPFAAIIGLLTLVNWIGSRFDNEY